MEYSLVTFNPSDIAMSSILNALEGLDTSLMSQGEKSSYIKSIEHISGINSRSKTIISTQSTIWELYKKSAQFELHDTEIVGDRRNGSNRNKKELADEEQSPQELSPVCVSSEQI